MNIIWLASYPRSGNTYLRFLLYNYYYGKVSDSRDVDEKVPDLHRNTALSDENPLFVKTHYPYDSKHPHLPRTRGFVYLTRNPADVLLSTIRYLNILLIEQKYTDQQLAELFINHRGIPLWDDVIGSWEKHISSWFSASGSHNGVYLRYESLRKDPFNALEQLFKHLNLAFDPESARTAVQESDIQKMRKLEEQEKVLGLKNPFCSDCKSDESFIGEGAVGQVLTQFSEEVQSDFKKIFLPVEKAFFDAIDSNPKANLI